MGEFDDYFKKNNITYQVNVSYSSKHNEKVKKVNYIIMSFV